MARGLSDLQKWMLVRALENSESDLCRKKTIEGIRGYCANYSYDPVHLERAEIRADFYKFPVCVDWVWNGHYYEPACLTPEKRRQRIRENGSGLCIKKEIPNYAAVNLAITRAHDRLRKRGLVTDQMGFWLTDKGREVARLLAAPAAVSTTGQPIRYVSADSAPRVADRVIEAAETSAG